MTPIAPSDRPAVDIGDTATPGGRCPACGQPLFAWLDPPAESGEARYVMDHCENCGLGLERIDGAEAAATEIERLRRDVAEHGVAELSSANAQSFQAGIGTESWAGLRLPEEPVLFTPRSLDLLLEHEGLEAETRFAAPGGMALMFQTILNLLSFNRDFAPRVLRGRLRPRDSRAGIAGFAIDVLVTVFTAVPVAALAVVMEGVAVLARRGGVLEARVRRAAARPAPG